MTPVVNRREDSSHWYFKDGSPCYEVDRADGKGKRSTTLRDARIMNLYPSVTTILKVLNKPELNRWITEQAVLACITTPIKPDEQMDQFINRVLNIEQVQDQEAQKAREFGTQIHDAIADVLRGGECSPMLSEYVAPVIKEVSRFGRLIAVEKCVVGDGYAGRLDVACEGDVIAVVDIKTTKKLPKESYSEHKLQLGAYARTMMGNTGDKRIVTANIYVDSTKPNNLVTTINDDWQETYANGFLPVLNYWQWVNKYKPQ